MIRPANIITDAEYRKIPWPPDAFYRQKKNPVGGIPACIVRQATREEDTGQAPILSSKVELRCKLLQSKYTWGKAHERCTEIHGTTFSGCFRSGRFFVFWERVEV